MKKKLFQINRHSFYIAGLISVVLLAACNKEQQKTAGQPLPVTGASVTATAQKPVQKAVSSSLRLPPPPVNQFDFSNKKDPFKPFVVKAEPKVNPEKDKRSLRDSLPIHSFDVGQFKLIGIVTGGKDNQAMATDPNGKGYVLKVGMLIGKNDGKITAINSGGVDILEQFRDDNGKIRKEYIKLTLPRKQ